MSFFQESKRKTMELYEFTKKYKGLKYIRYITIYILIYENLY